MNPVRLQLEKYTMLSTKIICTIGPASDSPQILEKLAEVGMNIARLNFSHGTHTSHKKIIQQIHELNQRRQFPIAIMLDTQGPEIRTGNETSDLVSKEIVTVSCPPFKENEGNIYVNYAALKSDLNPGNYISIDSGLVKLKVLGKHKKGLKCEVIDGGIVNGHRHVNLPGTVVKLPGITEADKRDILFGIKHNVNYIALSFVRSSETIREVRELLGKNASHTEIIAKVENQEGVERLEEIVQEAGYSKSSSSMEMLGRQFAELHRYRGKKFGFYEDNLLGDSPQSNKPSKEGSLNWAEFYAENRLEFQTSLAVKKGYATPELTNLMDNLIKKLPDLILGTEEEPSLLHGDLWSGNYLIDGSGIPWLIDPAVYYGHREADMAMTTLFGGFSNSFYSAYKSSYPIAPGYAEREPLYQLYHLLNHLNLFGTGYYGQVISILRRYAA